MSVGRNLEEYRDPSRSIETDLNVTFSDDNWEDPRFTFPIVSELIFDCDYHKNTRTEDSPLQPHLCDVTYT